MTAIVHVGLPKCASTSLQALFVHATGTTFLGKGKEVSRSALLIDRVQSAILRRPRRLRESLYESGRIRNIFRDALPSDRPLDDAEIATMRRDILAAVARMKGDPSRVLVSDEVLSGMGFIFFNQPRRPLEGIVREVGRIFGGDAAVMLVMRSQMSFLASYWKHLVRTGYPFTWGHFLSEQSSDPVRWDSWRSVTATLFYDRIRREAEAAGVRMVFVPFEDVVGDQTILRAFLDREGIAMPRELPHRRQTNTDESHIAKLERNRTGLRKRGTMFRPEDLEADEAAFRSVLQTRVLLDPVPDRERLTEAFRPGNRAFAEATGIDLKALKYPV